MSIVVSFSEVAVAGNQVKLEILVKKAQTGRPEVYTCGFDPPALLAVVPDLLVSL